MSPFAAVIEKTATNMARYVPNLPGCVPTADSPQEQRQAIREAVALHLEGMAEDGSPMPKPPSRVHCAWVYPPRAESFVSLDEQRLDAPSCWAEEAPMSSRAILPACPKLRDVLLPRTAALDQGVSSLRKTRGAEFPQYLRAAELYGEPPEW